MNFLKCKQHLCFEMKKSCPEKELKVVTTKDAEGCLNDSKGEHLTEEQIYINKKLSESGIEDEGLDWLEKKNILKTINVSLKTSTNERNSRTSPRLAKTLKWIENSFESNKKEDSAKNSDDEKASKTRRGKADSEVTDTPTSNTVSPSNNKIDQELQENVLKCIKKELHKNVEINGDSPKTSKKVHYIKIQVEGREECSATPEDSSGDQGSAGGKKRSSPPELDIADTPKKPKMEQTETSNGVPQEESVPLKIELEMEKRRRNLPFKIRDIKTIVFECEIRNKRWKETFSKYKCPARWGIPIVKSCNEKWDGKRIPPKLLHRYQKYLSSNNLHHPVFFPENSEICDDISKLSFEISSQSSVGTNSECKDELENHFRNTQEGSFAEDELNNSNSENNLNASTSDDSGRMVLRNRNTPKLSAIYEDDISSDDSDEWSSKKKPVKKQKINSKNKKLANQNKQLLLKLEKCNINKKNGMEDSKKNGEGNEDGFVDRSIMGINSSSQSSSQSKSGPDPDTMVCPICSLRFKKQLIESHATECATKTYKD